VRIGLIADTHMPRFGSALPRALREGLTTNRVELILHMGDFTEPFVAELFREIAPFDAVAGNNDSEEIARRFGRRKILTIEGVRIGMVHGDGRNRSTLDRAINAFSGEHVPIAKNIARSGW
jgi:putative phosphoesterase